jgi:hypothetical protein
VGTHRDKPNGPEYKTHQRGLCEMPGRKCKCDGQVLKAPVVGASTQYVEFIGLAPKKGNANCVEFSRDYLDLLVV